MIDHEITIRDIVEGRYKPIKGKYQDTIMDIDEVARDLGLDCCIGWSKEFNDRVKGWYIESWMCTDTHVGFAVFYMDDEVIAFSYQSARKSAEAYEFVSEEAADKLRAFILSLMEDEPNKPSLINLDMVIKPHFNVEYTEAILVNEGFYKGELVKVVPNQVVRNYSRPLEEWSRLDVEKPNGEIIRISTEEFNIPMYLEKVEEQ